MANPEVPNFAALLAPAISDLPDAARPALLCGLERAAAQRYREWADALPGHGDALRACAVREDEIADRVAGLFALDAAGQRVVDRALPAAIAVFLEAFAPYSVPNQLFVQSEAELQGAAAWAGIAAGLQDAGAKRILARCSALEEESSRAVKAILAELVQATT